MKVQTLFLLLWTICWIVSWVLFPLLLFKIRYSLLCELVAVFNPFVWVGVSVLQRLLKQLY